MSRFFSSLICSFSLRTVNINNMTVILNNKVHVRDNYKEPTDEKFDDCTSEILKKLGQRTVLTARVIQWKITDGQNQTKNS